MILSLHGAPSYGLIGLRASFNGASFFQGGLGFHKGLYMVVESDDSWRVITAVASLGATLPLPACDAAKNCLRSGALRRGWRRIQLSVRNATATILVDGVIPPDGGGFPIPTDIRQGFAALGSSWAPVSFDILTISATSPEVFPVAKPQPGSTLKGVPCGERALLAGSQWEVQNRSGLGRLSLRSQPDLCLSFDNATSKTPKVQACNTTATDDQVWAVNGG